jgi:hypothetical protein
VDDGREGQDLRVLPWVTRGFPRFQWQKFRGKEEKRYGE